MKYTLLLISAIILISCKKENYEDLIPVSTPTEVSNTITGDYLYYIDDYHDGVGEVFREGNFTVTTNSYEHELDGYREILYYPDHPTWIRLHDTTTDVSDVDHWTEQVLEYQGSGTQGIYSYYEFKQLNDNEDHIIKWFY